MKTTKTKTTKTTKTAKTSKKTVAKVIDIHSRLPIENPKKVPTKKVEVKVEKVAKVKVTNKSNTGVKVLGLLVMITSLTVYLVSQNYAFFGAIIKTGATIIVLGSPLCVPALVNSVIAEMILLSAAAFTSSRTTMIRVVAWVIMLGMICGLGAFMHASLDNDFTGNSEYVQSLKQQKVDAITAKDGYEEDKANLDPIIWKTRRDAIQTKIDIERTNIVALDKKISEAKDVSSTNLQSIVFYNTVLRVFAMVVNAMLVHTLIGFMVVVPRKHSKKVTEVKIANVLKAA